MKYFSDAPLFDKFLTFSTNNMLGWKGLPGTNTLAYYKHSYITDVKMIVASTPEHNVM